MTTCENYEVYSHQQIRHEMYDGAGPSSQAEAMTGWHELAGRLTSIRRYLDSAIGGVLASRQGVATDAAVGAMIPLGPWLDEAQRLANDTRDRIDHQIAGFTTARDSIPEVPPEPRGSDWQDYAVIDLVTISDQEADEAFNAEQQRRARAAMMLYQDATNERVDNVVQFTPPPAGAPDLTITTTRNSGGIGSGRGPVGRNGLGSFGGPPGRSASDGFGPRGGRGRGAGGLGPARGPGPSDQQPPVRGRGAGRPGALPTAPAVIGEGPSNDDEPGRP